MDLIKFSIKNPVTIIVSVLIVVLFGFLSLSKLPYQLTPSVTKPEIKITTTWGGATPHEVEREIIEEQEDALKSLNNLEKYESSASDDQGEITLTFKLSTDIRVALQDVSNKLNEVSSYPDNVDEPIIETATAFIKYHNKYCPLNRYSGTELEGKTEEYQHFRSKHLLSNLKTGFSRGIVFNISQQSTSYSLNKLTVNSFPVSNNIFCCI